MPRVAAVVITYNPDEQFARRLKAIARECQPVYVVDNGSAAAGLNRLRSAVRAARAKLIALGQNTGIAHAQNVGLTTAFSAKAAAVILFDHDSEPRRGFAAALMAAVAQEDKPVIAGSRVYDLNLRAFARHPCNSALFSRREAGAESVLRELLMVIASGTLITREVFIRTGGMRENLFIDYVDWEYCLRARHQFGIGVIVAGAAVLEHERGKREPRRVLGITLHPPGYSAMRYGHMFRNRARLFREYFWHDRAFIAFEVVATARDFLLLFAEKNRWSLVWLALRSWFSGLLG